jgi:hypothetical protein
MRITIFSMVFMSIWCGGIALALVVSLIQGDYELGTVGIMCGMLLFGYFMVMGGYWFESKKAKDLLLSITQGRIADHND